MLTKQGGRIRKGERVGGELKGRGKHINKGRKAGSQKSEVRVTTINVRGLKQPRKYESAKMLLSDLQIDVCVMTETHLNLQEVDDLHFPGYEVKGKSCRAYSADGGAILLFT